MIHVSPRMRGILIHMRKSKIESLSIEELGLLVAASSTMSEVLRALCLVDRGANHKRLKDYLLEKGIDTSHLLGRGWSLGHKSSVKAKRDISDYLEGRVTNTSSSYLRKRLVEEGYLENRCLWCGIRDWFGFPITLELDHIDWNPSNNALSNLRILCPNCHALTPTYRGRNIKRDCPALAILSEKCSTIPCVCGGQKSKGAELCWTCYQLTKPPGGYSGKIVDWPDAVVLLNRLNAGESYKSIAVEIGVAENSIRKYLKRMLGDFPRKRARRGCSKANIC